MEFQIKKVEKGDIDTEELKKQIPGWCSLLKKSPDDERLRIIVASMFYFIDEKEKSLELLKNAPSILDYLNDEEKEERKLYGNGRQNRRVLTLTRFPVIIGRKPEYADLVINEPSVDSMHVKILEEDGHIYMEDMNAAAGTFKNGIQLRPYERVELLREDEVKFGKLEFTYR